MLWICQCKKYFLFIVYPLVSELRLYNDTDATLNDKPSKEDYDLVDLDVDEDEKKGLQQHSDGTQLKNDSVDHDGRAQRNQTQQLTDCIQQQYLY